MTILEEIGTDVRHEGALELLRALGQDVDGERVRWDREFVMEMAGRAPASFTLAAAQPRAGGHDRRRQAGADARRRLAVLLRPRARPPRGHDRRLRRADQDGACRRPHDLPAERHRRGLRPRRAHPPHGHGLRHPALVGQAARLLRHLRPEGARRGRPGGDRAAAGARRSRRRPAIMGVVNPNSPLVWDGPDGRRPHGVGGRGPAGGRDPVPARRRDRAGQHRRRARPAGGRGALGRRARPGRPAGRAVPLRVVLHRRRHAHRRARRSARRSRSSGRSPAASSPAATGFRTAAAAASARRTPSTSRRRPRRPTRSGRR